MPSSICQDRLIIESNVNVDTTSDKNSSAPEKGNTDTGAEPTSTTKDDISNISEEFDKVVIDHRAVVQHNRIIGLHTNKTIVVYEINKTSDFFHVKTESDSDYEDLKTVLEEFRDIRQYYNIWRTETGEMYKEWKKYKDKLTL